MRFLGFLLLVACSSAAPTSNEPDPTVDAFRPNPVEPPEPTANEPACVGLTYESGTYTDVAIAWDGRTRRFDAYVPTSYDKTRRTPLVISLHGGGGNAQVHEQMVHLISKAEKEGFILITPNGTGRLLTPNLRTWNAGNCCGAAMENRVDDVGFIRHLLETLDSLACVDHRRVFATGFSNGALMAHRLACELSDRIAAIAPVSGGIGDRDPALSPAAIKFACLPPRPVPVFEIHGLSDGVYPFVGGRPTCAAAATTNDATFVSIPDTVSDWVGRNGCSNVASQTLLAGAARCETHSGCTLGADVTLCTISGGGHYWPGGTAAVPGGWGCPGILSNDMSANDAMWTFFQTHALPN